MGVAPVTLTKTWSNSLTMDGTRKGSFDNLLNAASLKVVREISNPEPSLLVKTSVSAPGQRSEGMSGSSCNSEKAKNATKSEREGICGSG